MAHSDDWNISKFQSHSKTVAYEVKMFFGTVNRYPAYFDKDWVLRNTIAESFAIHYRNLVIFLFSRRGEKKSFPVFDTDVIATDFSPTWSGICPTIIPPKLLEAKIDADKQIAHITEDREGLNQAGSTKKAEWNHSQLAYAIAPLLQQFISSVPSGRLDPVECDQMNHDIAAWLPGSSATPQRSDSTMCGSTASPPFPG